MGGRRTIGGQLSSSGDRRQTAHCVARQSSSCPWRTAKRTMDHRTRDRERGHLVERVHRVSTQSLMSSLRRTRLCRCNLQRSWITCGPCRCKGQPRVRSEGFPRWRAASRRRTHSLPESCSLSDSCACRKWRWSGSGPRGGSQNPLSKILRMSQSVTAASMAARPESETRSSSRQRSTRRALGPE